MNQVRNYIKSLFLIELLRGLMLTISYLVSPKVTVRYPEEKTPQGIAFVGCMRCAATPTAKSAASRASCARRFVQRSPLPSSPSSAPTGRGAPHDMISI